MCAKKGFHTIVAWQKADDLVVKVYEVTDLKKGYFPKHQLYSLIQQLQKAAVSVAANIAEGSGRGSIPDFLRFLYISQGSLRELVYYIHLANRLGYLSSDADKELDAMAEQTARVLTGFIRFKKQEAQAANS